MGASSAASRSRVSAGAPGSKCTLRDAQHALLAVGLEIDAGDEGLVQQEGQDIITVGPLRRGRVDLDPVAEAEQALRAVAQPDQRVEGGEQGLARDPARAARLGVKEGGLAPAFDRDREEGAFLDQRGDRRPRLLHAQPEIVAQVRGGGDAERAGGESDEAAMRLRLVGGRQGEDRGRDHALGEIVDAREAAPPGGGGDASRPEQIFERALGVAPLPPAAAALALLEVRGRQRPLGCDPRQHRFRLGAALGGEGAHVPPADLAALRARHPPAQQGMERERQQRGLVRPIFEQSALAPAAPGGAVEEGGVVGAEPRESGQIMGAHEHVDAVDLVQSEPIEQPPERRPARHRRPRPAEALRGKRDPAGGGKREAVGAARHGERRAEAGPPLKRPRWDQCALTRWLPSACCTKPKRSPVNRCDDVRGGAGVLARLDRGEACRRRPARRAGAAGRRDRARRRRRRRDSRPCAAPPASPAARRARRACRSRVTISVTCSNAASSSRTLPGPSSSGSWRTANARLGPVEELARGRELALGDLERQAGEQGRRRHVAQRAAVEALDRGERGGRDLDLDPAAAARIEAVADQLRASTRGPMRLTIGRKRPRDEIERRRHHIVGAALEHEPRRPVGERAAASARLEHEPRAPRSADRETIVAGADRARPEKRSRARRSPRPRNRRSPIAQAASTAVRCWRISPGFSRRPRMLVMRNGWPVTSDRASALRSTCPPPSPSDPSMMITIFPSR